MISYATRNLPFVDYSTWPDPGGLNVLLLTDQELHIVHQLTFPRAFSIDAIGTPLPGRRFQWLQGDDYTNYLDIVRDLKIKLTGGIGMDISSFVAGVAAGINPYADKVQNLSLTSGDSNQYHTAVPSNTLCHITCASFSYWGTLPTQIMLVASIAGVAWGVNTWLKAAMVSNVTYGYQLDLWLSPADSLYWWINGGTLNDDFIGTTSGYTLATA